MEDGSAGQPGELLAGRYRLGEPLGSGGMGQVFRGRDDVLARPVAIKLFRSDVVGSDVVRRQTMETQIAAGLNHPGLVTVFDAGADGGRAFLVMELVDGETLSQRIARGPIPPAEVAEIGAQVAEAVDALHTAGIVHRDIKPSNVLLGPGGAGRIQAKLTDFGISRLLTDATRLTSTGLLMGTPRYFSPEQAAGEPVGLPSDIFALGLVLLECLTGQTPYPGTAVETSVARLMRPPPVPASVGPLWQGLLTAMTAREPAARPTGLEVANRLRSYDGSDVTRRLPGVLLSPVATSPTAVLDVSPVVGADEGGRPSRLRLLVFGLAAALAAVLLGAFLVDSLSGGQGAGAASTAGRTGGATGDPASGVGTRTGSGSAGGAGTSTVTQEPTTPPASTTAPTTARVTTTPTGKPPKHDKPPKGEKPPKHDKPKGDKPPKHDKPKGDKPKGHH